MEGAWQKVQIQVMGKIEQGTSCWNITSGTGVKEVRERRGSLGARTWASSKRDDTLWEMIGRARTVLESPGV